MPNAGALIEGLLISSFPAGIVFFISGKLMQRTPPQWPNNWYGYRTKTSLRTEASFAAANTYAAALLIKYSTSMIVFGLIMAYGFSDREWVLYLSAGVVMVLIMIVALIIRTEKYLRSNFDKDGLPRV